LLSVLVRHSPNRLRNAVGSVLGILGRRQYDPPQSPRLFSALRRLAIDPQQLAIESNMTSLS
jgi:hypothetical protein